MPTISPTSSVGIDAARDVGDHHACARPGWRPRAPRSRPRWGSSPRRRAPGRTAPGSCARSRCPPSGGRGARRRWSRGSRAARRRRTVRASSRRLGGGGQARAEHHRHLGAGGVQAFGDRLGGDADSIVKVGVELHGEALQVSVVSDLAQHQRARPRASGADGERPQRQLPGRPQVRGSLYQSVARPPPRRDRITLLGVQGDADRGIDLVLLAQPARPQQRWRPGRWPGRPGAAPSRGGRPAAPAGGARAAGARDAPAPRASPPCRATARSQPLHPGARGDGRLDAPRARLAAIGPPRPRRSISAPRRTVSARVSSGPAAAQDLQRLGQLAGVAHLRGPAAGPSPSAAPPWAAPAAGPGPPGCAPAAGSAAAEGRNAPRPSFTSSNSASAPPATFLDRMDEAMSGMLSTVAVASRRAYSVRSAGTSRGVCPAMTKPVARSTRAELRRASAGGGSRGWPPACPACRRCAPAPARPAWAPPPRRRPPAAPGRS